jgi:hypothetical protein
MERDIVRADLWTKEQAQEWANRYWQIRSDKSLSEDERRDRLIAHEREFKPVRDVCPNDQGNTVVRRHRSADRYIFDFDSDFRSLGWLQFDTDQDASYFGVWVNRRLFRTLSYCEGDVYLVVCVDVEHYNAEIKALCEFHGEGFEMIACDIDAARSLLLGGDAKGKATVYRQDRNQFFAPAEKLP